MMKRILLLISVTLLAFAGVSAQTSPPGLEQTLAGITGEKYPGAPAVIVLDETKVDVEDSGLSHVNRRIVVKVLNEEGCLRYSTYRLDYDPASSFAEIKSIETIRDGKREKLPQEEIRDLPQPQMMIYWGPRMKLASIPRLNPGDAVEINTYSKGFVIAYLAAGEGARDDERYIPPMRGHYYDVVLFQGDLPIVRKSYELVMPRDKLLNARVYHGEVGFETSYDKDKVRYLWSKENASPIDEEPRMVESTDVATKVVLATAEDWPAKSRWFYEVNENAKAFEWNPDIKKKVDELTSGLRTDDEKRKALLAWVAREIRYSGISMGKGEGYTLHPGGMTFNDRAGVCKDIAGMLITMLRCAGYTTYPAMTMAGAKVEDVPADQFNHCVVAVKLGPGEYKLYDPTWCPFSREVWSSAEKPQNYVIGSPEGEVLMETPLAPPEDNFIKVVSTGRLDADGTLNGRMHITGGAYSETNLVWAVTSTDKNEVRHVFEEWIHKIAPQAELISFATEDPVNVNKPFFITLDYRVPGYAIKAGRDLLFRSPAAQNILSSRRLTDFVAAAEGEERKHDIYLRSTRKFIFDEKIELPAIRKNADVNDPESIDGPAAGFDAKASSSGKYFELKETFSVKKKIVPASDHRNLKEAYEAMKDFGSRYYRAAY